MKKYMVILSCFCLLVALAACARANDTTVSDDQANAYFLVFQDIYESDSALNDSIVFIAVDLSGVTASSTKRLESLIQAFCDEKGYAFLQDTAMGLYEKGYVEDTYIKEGICIALKDKSLTEDTLITAGEKLRAEGFARGCDYTVAKNNGAWAIVEKTNGWMS